MGKTKDNNDTSHFDALPPHADSKPIRLKAPDGEIVEVDSWRIAEGLMSIGFTVMSTGSARLIFRLQGEVGDPVEVRHISVADLMMAQGYTLLEVIDEDAQDGEGIQNGTNRQTPEG